MTFKRIMSLIAMAFLWTASQIPVYLFGGVSIVHTNFQAPKTDSNAGPSIYLRRHWWHRPLDLVRAREPTVSSSRVPFRRFTLRSHGSPLRRPARRRFHHPWHDHLVYCTHHERLHWRHDLRGRRRWHQRIDCPCRHFRACANSEARQVCCRLDFYHYSVLSVCTLGSAYCISFQLAMDRLAVRSLGDYRLPDDVLLLLPSSSGQLPRFD